MSRSKTRGHIILYLKHLPHSLHRLSPHHISDIVQFNLNRQPSAAGSVKSNLNVIYFHEAPSASRTTHFLVHVPVEAGILQDEPVLLPFLRKVAFGILLLPEPAFAVSSTQVFAWDSPLADGGQRCAWRFNQKAGNIAEVSGTLRWKNRLYSSGYQPWRIHLLEDFSSNHNQTHLTT